MCGMYFVRKIWVRRISTSKRSPTIYFDSLLVGLCLHTSTIGGLSYPQPSITNKMEPKGTATRQDMLLFRAQLIGWVASPPRSKTSTVDLGSKPLTKNMVQLHHMCPYAYK